ncbi:TIGR02449 family protein [Spongiibacter marinus]|uniref:TIGR02449 family protein n=1 Tax=Spongiibacter marinus TaxID=354246 RepID=UPI001F2748B2|nr:TIGR02449 family protein [Spongiibacter marinus]
MVALIRRKIEYPPLFIPPRITVDRALAPTLLWRHHSRPWSYAIMDDRQLQVLERKVDELIQLCEQLDAENRTLKSETQNWKIEREALIEKTDTARAKVDAMIQRLRALEKEC